MPASPPPTVLAFILCDNVQHDARDKLYLLGLFSTFDAPAFPATLRDSWMYGALTDGRGEVALALRLTDAADLDAAPVFRTEVPVRFRGPLDVAEVVLQFAALTFPAPGVYAWEVLCDGRVIYERRLVVRQVGRPAAGPD